MLSIYPILISEVFSVVDSLENMVQGMKTD